MSQTELGGVVRKTVDAETNSDVIEENIAGFENRFVQIHNSVSFLPINPALELPPIKRPVPWAKRSETLRRDFVFQHRRGGHDLKDRARSKLRLNGAIQQRMLRIFVELLPLIRRDEIGRASCRERV